MGLHIFYFYFYFSFVSPLSVLDFGFSCLNLLLPGLERYRPWSSFFIWGVYFIFILFFIFFRTEDNVAPCGEGERKMKEKGKGEWIDGWIYLWEEFDKRSAMAAIVGYCYFTTYHTLR